MRSAQHRSQTINISTSARGNLCPMLSRIYSTFLCQQSEAAKFFRNILWHFNVCGEIFTVHASLNTWLSQQEREKGRCRLQGTTHHHNDFVVCDHNAARIIIYIHRGALLRIQWGYTIRKTTPRGLKTCSQKKTHWIGEAWFPDNGVECNGLIRASLSVAFVSAWLGCSKVSRWLYFASASNVDLQDILNKK
jgi:hypothetical protein